MGKRSSFDRKPRDFYRTPPGAVVSLSIHLKPSTRYVEPCAGDGALIDALFSYGHECTWASDIDPKGPAIERADALAVNWKMKDEIFITNPPWDRKILHPLITYLSDRAPIWLLFDADWMHTRQAVPYLPSLRHIQSIGRVKWIPDSKFTGKDNCCWYLFDTNYDTPPMFSGRIM